MGKIPTAYILTNFIVNLVNSTDSLGETTTYQYDALNRLTKETQKKPDSGHIVTYTSEYTFDENNNILTQTTTHPGDGYSFDYKQNGSDYSINNITMHNTLYNYDANNRLLNKREIVGGTGSYTGQIEKVTNFTYDKNGNTIKKDIGGQVDRNVVEYVYNTLNQLKEVKSDGITVGAYTYSGNGLRRSRTANGTITKYYWDGQNVVNESVNGEITATNKYGIHGLYHRSGVGDIMRNKHGDVIGVVSEGTVTHHYSYDAYGNQKTSNENDTNPLRYCGEYYDDESGLIYLRNRYYDPDLGRFINEDPIKSGANWYAYANNNPIMYIDPQGLDAIVLGNKNSGRSSEDASGGVAFGHLAIIVQDANGNWYYFSCGNKVAAVIRIPDSYLNNGIVSSMDSLDNFNAYLNKFLTDNGFTGITSNYTDATYVVGNFTASLTTAFGLARAAGNCVEFNDGSVVYQRDVSLYNLGWYNCLQHTIDTFSLGTMDDGTSVSTYLIGCGYSNGIIPKDAIAEFSQMFMNSSFAYGKAYDSILNYATLYRQKSSDAKVASKGNYAYSVVGW